MIGTRRSFLGVGLLSAFSMHLLKAQGGPSFSGVWKLNEERSTPKRKGEVTLVIVQHDPELTVETIISAGSGSPRTAKQRYSTDGKRSTTTGADGDEFLTSIVKSGAALLFTIEEHEDGRILHSNETWSLLEGGSTLERIREFADGRPKQTLIYLRQAS